jgi:hypothetical protein
VPDGALFQLLNTSSKSRVRPNEPIVERCGSFRFESICPFVKQSTNVHCSRIADMRRACLAAALGDVVFCATATISHGTPPLSADALPRPAGAPRRPWEVGKGLSQFVSINMLKR